MAKTLLKIVLNSLIGVILILIWLKFVNILEILKTLSSTNGVGLIPVFLFMLLSPVIRAVRLKVFLSEIRRISLKDLIFLNGVAMMLNFFIPIRAGEIAKGVYLNTKYGLDLAKSIVWIFLDRLLDFLVVLLLAAALFFAVPTTLSIAVIIVITVILSFGLGLTYLAVFQADLSRKIAKFLTNLLIINTIKISFDRLINFFLDGFAILKRSPQELLLLIVLTIFAYGADAAIWYFTFLSLNSPQGFLKMYLGQLLSALTYLIPAAPGYLGSAEASGLLILSGVFGLDPNLSSAMTVLFHVTSIIFVLVFGLISVYSLKINLGLVLQKALRKKG